MFRQVPNTWLASLFSFGQSHCVFLCINVEIPQPKPSLPMEIIFVNQSWKGCSLFTAPRESVWFLSALICFCAWRTKRTKTLWYLGVLGFVVTLSKCQGKQKYALYPSLWLSWGEGSRPQIDLKPIIFVILYGKE